MDPTRLKKSDKYDVKFCAYCTKHEFKGRWIKTESMEEAVYDMIEQRFKGAKKVELFIPEHKHNAGVNALSEALVDDKIVPIKIQHTICRHCSKRTAQAYNGILQIRNMTDEMIEFADEVLFKGEEKGYFVTKRDELKNGIDYRLSDATFTRRIGRVLQNKFGGEIKENAKLVTKDYLTQKELHRVVVLFRVPDFKKGDIVSYKGREVEVLSIGKKVYVQDIKTKRKDHIAYDRIQK